MDLYEIGEKDFNRIRNYYVSALEKHGAESPRAVHWLSLRNQLVRFDTLAKINNLSGHSVLDVGCGLGDLHEFLHGRYTDVNYMGIDIVPEMIARAQHKYPHAAFMVSDVFAYHDSTDYILSSGAMTFHIAQGREYYYAMIEQMYCVAKKGVAFNLLNEQNYSTGEKYLSYNVDEVAAVCARLTKNYQIIIGYLEGDFTVFLYK